MSRHLSLQVLRAEEGKLMRSAVAEELLVRAIAGDDEDECEDCEDDDDWGI